MIASVTPLYEGHRNSKLYTASFFDVTVRQNAAVIWDVIRLDFLDDMMVQNVGNLFGTLILSTLIVLV